MVTDLKTIAYALRCSAGYKLGCEKGECPYFIEDDDEARRFMEEHFPDQETPDDFFEGCDCEQIALDAAEILEEIIRKEDDGK